MSYDCSGKFTKFGDPAINSSKNIAKKHRIIFKPIVTIEFKLKNALDFYNFFKMDLLKFPKDGIF